MLTEGAILAIVSTSVLVISECLPFIHGTDGNGITHSILLAIMKALTAMRQEPNTETQKY
jgi:hypothetical protein